MALLNSPVAIEDRVTSFEDWTGGRRIQSIGTNAGADALPFQSWRNFKEAFAPELIQRAISESRIPVQTCLDPFGGSGTTALACQFLGVRPITVEVNPFLADLIEAKLSVYDLQEVARDFARLIRSANRKRLNPRTFFAVGPPTFVQPGVDDRWIFDTPIARRLAGYVSSLREISNPTNRRLLKALLGGVLIDVSNVVVSGKGRRYRKNWADRRMVAVDLDEAFCASVENAVDDIVRFGERSETRYKVVRGDARTSLKRIRNFDLCVFSPPYPNSFDYTDVYNVELWGMRYLKRAKDNSLLRLSTLSSHVQIKREYAKAPDKSLLLNSTLKKLRARQDDLWNRNIPDMVGAYFADMTQVISAIGKRLSPSGQIWIVVGDSRYAKIRIPVADILSELAPSLGLQVELNEPFRSMRSSAQQGWENSLDETLLVLGRT